MNKTIWVKLKWGETEYKGRLVSYASTSWDDPPRDWRERGLTRQTAPYRTDSYINIQLSETEEYIDQKFSGSLGQVLIRCADGPQPFPS